MVTRRLFLFRWQTEDLGVRSGRRGLCSAGVHRLHDVLSVVRHRNCSSPLLLTSRSFTLHSSIHAFVHSFNPFEVKPLFPFLDFQSRFYSLQIIKSSHSSFSFKLFSSLHLFPSFLPPLPSGPPALPSWCYLPREEAAAAGGGAVSLRSSTDEMYWVQRGDSPAAAYTCPDCQSRLDQDPQDPHTDPPPGLTDPPQGAGRRPSSAHAHPSQPPPPQLPSQLRSARSFPSRYTSTSLASSTLPRLETLIT